MADSAAREPARVRASARRAVRVATGAATVPPVPALSYESPGRFPMRHRVRASAVCVSAALAAFALVLAPLQAARADDKAPKAEGGKEGGGKEGDGKNGDPKNGDPKNDARARVNEEQIARVERAKRLVRELETSIAVLKAAKTADVETIQSLEKALEDARKLAQPITASELTEEERKRLADEMKKDGEDAPPKDGGGGPGDEWRQRALAGAFKDADLSEAEQMTATKIINEWYPKSTAAWASRDSKAISDLKRERDESLEKALGKKKAQKVINNLNAMGGRGGR
jgi:hypothetical protein